MNERLYNSSLLKKERNILPVSKGGDIRVVVAYPNTYAVGMSNLGLHSVYKLFNEERRFVVERAFIPTYEAAVKKTFESHSSLSSVDVFAVSVSFEADYQNVVSLLDAAGLNLDSCVGEDSCKTRRSLEHISRPFILGGGAALTINPEPVARLFDAIVIGDAEEVIPEISKELIKWHDFKISFCELLYSLANIDGVYVPSMFDISYCESGAIDSINIANDGVKIPKRAVCRCIENYPTYSAIITPKTELSSMMLIETGRGCATGCRFCVASKIYQPVRNQSYETIDAIIKGVPNRLESNTLDAEKTDSHVIGAIGLVGTSVSKHPDIKRMVSDITNLGMQCGISSIMSQCVTNELASVIAKSGVLTVALAPEAATESLRFRIGKRVTNEMILDAVKNLVSNGVCALKLYFMVGLAGETTQDVLAIGEFANEILLEARSVGSLRKLHLSVNPFIPKPWTPFQWDRFVDVQLLRKRFNIVRNFVRKLNGISVKFESVRECYVQAALARGDRRLCDLLVSLHKDKRDLLDCVSKGNVKILSHVPSLDFYAYSEHALDGILAWEVIDMGISKDKLQSEYLISHNLR